MKIKNIRRDENSKQVRFTIIWYDTFYHIEDEADFMTNKNGNGLFVEGDYYKQLAGTCQFSLHQETYSGLYKAIKKYFEYLEM